MQTLLIDIARIGIGMIFLISIVLDFKTRPQIFALMDQKKVPMPWLCFIGAAIWKALVSLALIFNFYSVFAALLLALYVFIANMIFNNFWHVPEEQKDLTLTLFIVHLAICFGLFAIAAFYL